MIPTVVVTISVTAEIELTEEATLETVKTEFLKNAAAYMAVVPEDKEVKYTKIGAILSATNGVQDYTAASLQVNGGTENIAIAVNEFPQILADNVTFTESV